MARLVICSKSAWTPPIRREHEVAQLAIAAGHDVVFAERPIDIRGIRSLGAVTWAKRLLFPATRRERGVLVVSRSTLVPGHRGVLATFADSFLLRRVLARWPGSVVVLSLPWDWPAVSRAPAARWVFDSADDWSSVMERNRARLRKLYAIAGTEADAVICDSPMLVHLFGGRDATVVANGAPRQLLEPALTPSPGSKVMVYTGTLSTRFDTELVHQVLERLPGWTIRIFGPAQYPGLGDDPAPELKALLARWGDRVDWRGVIPKEQMVDALDGGDVLVIPHRVEGATTGDTMKFYDY
ncbi:MAG TPA: glycosyltransferase, partial [Gaiellales bacterium]